jgi:hypothetical protein
MLSRRARLCVWSQEDAPSMALTAARHPTAGAQYHWSYHLAPRFRRFISFFQGR